MNEFRRDLQLHTERIVADSPIDPKSRLGDIIQYLAKHNLLLQRKKDENFDIKNDLEISDETKIYLNALQTEKMYHCRQCYYKNGTKCDFHAKYIFTNDEKNNYDEYINFLNSEMGIISFIELYYTYLGLDMWKITAQIMLKDLTGFETVTKLLRHYDYEVSDDADEPRVTPMDMDDDSCNEQ
ncbi:hypothetical protein AhnVgp018 [Adoxophyes honmai nucleopolyhedrovirus]|uniref:Ac34-like protein n=1 Tax=Adoxophyes honmai nucleopolyhedrovirus TaxID=224399 RepID=Q80LS8_NPVAH|nr:hypothetical protein AhnVgp018 [Adoxophyes honmai nucleopolyhedrovirus]BAC67269.1 hypothetical protein [Adoxophyes honmai nucleopolyhedrovirus]